MKKKTAGLLLLPLSISICLFLLLSISAADEIHGCGGFVQASSGLSTGRFDLSDITVELCTREGLVKDSAQCAPNGYYFIPVYDRGAFVLRVKGPAGWSWHPNRVPVTVDRDGCNGNEDINFKFTGFMISGRVVGRVGGESCEAKNRGPAGVRVELLAPSGDLISQVVTSDAGDYSFPNVIPGNYKLSASNKITKSIISPLPTTYSGAFRGLIKSMLRRSPEHRPSAGELLKHPHLQPYVLQVHLKSMTPGHHTPVPPIKHSHLPSPKIKRISFPKEEAEQEIVDIGKEGSVCNDKRMNNRRGSFGNEKIVKPSAERVSVSSTQSVKYIGNSSRQRTKEFSTGSNQVGEVNSVARSTINRRHSSIMNTPKYTPSKTITTPRSHVEASRTFHLNTKYEEVQSSCTPAKHTDNTRAARRASLPLPTSAYHASRRSLGMLSQIDSPNVSVNAPHIDRMVEFPLASDDPLFPLPCKPDLSPSAKWSPVDCSITKDKCTVQIFNSETKHGNGNGSDDTTGISSRGSSDSRRRFDTSSYQQRAEALEGLLEFSAHLLQQERYDELNILLKPFGPEKVSPRETAIWLTKSFKETGL